ncbi:GNAT family N-acetyltransferase [Hyphomicrobium facile]|uniref:Acetyltransferase involved in cellulose biosynthesis, CelD/BcsL family n=1 Tax=Hyphomicrobium facile TaxID=51670 RepID=A0A1I7NLD9_9HYPH|nr:GNAT family N-acetyltransferase [Hyphomicrobium facile]SFV35458.1 Acetyltransferase involved in cellulose biosynthesis, CelD/BcsL family [Hyphomicrobium facile]
MATVETGGGAILRAGGGWSRVLNSRGGRFITEVFDGADEALAAFEAVETGLVSNGFQTLDWLTVLYEELAPARKAMPRLVVVTEQSSGDVALVLPLVVAKERMLRVASFADLGVSDYGGPILGPVRLTDRRAIRRVWRSVRSAMRDIDLIRFERMPAEIGGRPNPLLTCLGRSPALRSGTELFLTDTADAHPRGIGKKYRKEVERCYRLWQKEPSPRFYRATTAEEIAHVYLALEEQRARRHAALHGKSVLDEPAYGSFYERLAIDGSDAGLSALFALEANGEIVATLFGIVHDGAFTRLAISTGGEEWSHLSPGRLVVIEAMKYFATRGVRRFDMGIGEHPLARGFGAREVPLYDLVVPTDGIALPAALLHLLRGHFQGKRVRRGAADIDQVAELR